MDTSKKNPTKDHVYPKIWKINKIHQTISRRLFATFYQEIRKGAINVKEAPTIEELKSFCVMYRAIRNHITKSKVAGKYKRHYNVTES